MDVIVVFGLFFCALFLFQLLVRLLRIKNLLNLKGILIASIFAGLEASVLIILLSYMDDSFETWDYFGRLALALKIFIGTSIVCSLLLILVYKFKHLDINNS